MDLVVLAVTRSWMYWMAPVLVGTGVSAVVAMARGYYRKVLDPWYRLRDQGAHAKLRSTTADVASLADARSVRERAAQRRLAA